MVVLLYDTKCLIVSNDNIDSEDTEHDTTTWVVPNDNADSTHNVHGAIIVKFLIVNLNIGCNWYK